MRRTREITETITRTEVTDYICNKCGESCKQGTVNYEGLIDVSVDGAYGSRYLGDGKLYTFSVCERCLYEFFQSCTYPPEVFDEIDGTATDFHRISSAVPKPSV